MRPFIPGLICSSIMLLTAEAAFGQNGCETYDGNGTVGQTFTAQCYEEVSEVTFFGEHYEVYYEAFNLPINGWAPAGGVIGLPEDFYSFTFHEEHHHCGPGCNDDCPGCDCTTWITTHTDVIPVSGVLCQLDVGLPILTIPPSAYGCGDGLLFQDAAYTSCDGYAIRLDGPWPDNAQWLYHAEAVDSIGGLSAGVYQVYFAGCTSDTIEVVVPDGECTSTAAASATDVSSIICADGRIEVTADRGASCLELYASLDRNGSLYAYQQIPGGSGTALFSDLAPGDYEVHVRLGDWWETVCDRMIPVHVGAPACEFPFDLLAAPSLEHPAEGCTHGELYLSNNTGCEWSVEVYDATMGLVAGPALADTMPMMGFVGIFEPGVYHVRAFGISTAPDGQIVECDVWSSVQFNYTAAPQQPDMINGPSGICEEAMGSYWITPVTDAVSYAWELPAAWSGTSVASSIAITAGSTGGWVTVAAVNGCGVSVAQALEVSVNELPEVSYTEAQTLLCSTDPAITLTPGSPAGGVYSGPGVSGNLFTPSTGLIGDNVITYAYTDGNGCSASATSLILVDVCSGLSSVVFDPVVTAAGPTNGVLTVSAPNTTILAARLIDQSGKTVLDRYSSAPGGTNSLALHLGEYARGMYILQVTTPKAMIMRRVVVVE